MEEEIKEIFWVNWGTGWEDGNLREQDWVLEAGWGGTEREEEWKRGLDGGRAFLLIGRNLVPGKQPVIHNDDSS